MSLLYEYLSFLLFHVLSFTKSNFCDLIARMISLGPNSPDLNSLDYHVWEQCWSLITSCNRRQTIPEFKDALQKCRWFGLPSEKAINNAVKDFPIRKRLQHVCQPTVDNLNIKCNNSHYRYI